MFARLKHVELKQLLLKRWSELADLDGLILPGGESTTMRKLIDKYGFMKPLKEFASKGKPMFGTCAGLILISKRSSGLS